MKKLIELNKEELEEVHAMVEKFWEIERYRDTMKQSQEELLVRLKPYFKVSKTWVFMSEEEEEEKKE